MFFLLPLLPVIAAAGSSAGAIAGGVAAGAAIGIAAKGIHDKHMEKSESETRRSHLVETADGVEFKCEETRNSRENFIQQKKMAVDNELKDADELFAALKRKKR